MFDWKNFKEKDVPTYSDKYKGNSKDFVSPQDLLGENLVIANPEYIEINGLDGVEFDVMRLDKDNRIERVRSYSKVLTGRFHKLEKEKMLPIKCKFRLRISGSGFEYIDLM